LSTWRTTSYTMPTLRCQPRAIISQEGCGEPLLCSASEVWRGMQQTEVEISNIAASSYGHGSRSGRHSLQIHSYCHDALHRDSPSGICSLCQCTAVLRRQVCASNRSAPAFRAFDII
jgi:hypothetical protein